MPSSRSSSKKSSKSSSKKSSSSSKKTKTRKHVRINSPLNQLRLYTLSSTEKANKKKGTPRYKVCPKYPEEDDFPCSKAYTVFENMHEYEQHKDDFGLRDHSKRASVRSHYSQMREKFATEGQIARKIPQEYRLYDADTGEVHDLRFFNK